MPGNSGANRLKAEVVMLGVGWGGRARARGWSGEAGSLEWGLEFRQGDRG